MSSYRAASFSSARSSIALDAIHIATALELGAALTHFVSYDKRLAAAAEENGLTVVAPDYRTEFTCRATR